MKITKESKIIHLSHIDLDGYGCQWVIDNAFDSVKFFNSNYGKEIDERIVQIGEYIKENDVEFVLVTDLNLTTGQCYDLQSVTLECGVDLKLIDHHASGKEQSELFEWYLLTDGTSATKLTYMWLDNIGLLEGKRKGFRIIIDSINAADIFDMSNKEIFSAGRMLSSIVYSVTEVTGDNKRSLIIHLLYKYAMLVRSEADLRQSKFDLYINMDKGRWAQNILGYSIQHMYLYEVFNNINAKMVIDNKSNHIYKLSASGARVFITFELPDVSTVSKDILTNCPEVDFVMNVSHSGTVSFRSEDYDVSKVAREIANGNGHALASGGRFTDLESFSLDNLVHELRVRGIIL